MFDNLERDVEREGRLRRERVRRGVAVSRGSREDLSNTSTRTSRGLTEDANRTGRARAPRDPPRRKPPSKARYPSSRTERDGEDARASSGAQDPTAARSQRTSAFEEAVFIDQCRVIQNGRLRTTSLLIARVKVKAQGAHSRSALHHPPRPRVPPHRRPPPTRPHSHVSQPAQRPPRERHPRSCRRRLGKRPRRTVRRALIWRTPRINPLATRHCATPPRGTRGNAHRPPSAPDAYVRGAHGGGTGTRSRVRVRVPDQVGVGSRRVAVAPRGQRQRRRRRSAAAGPRPRRSARPARRRGE